MHRVAIVIFSALLLTPAWGIETFVQSVGVYETTQPTNTQVPNWTTGWPTSGVTGWNYVGSVAGASGVYLGNGWVLTAAHVGFGNFTLGTAPAYTAVPGSLNYIYNSDGTMADIVLFKIQTSPSLLPLPMSISDPIAYYTTPPGTPVVMLGFGGGAGLSWGFDNVTEINETVSHPSSLPYISNDFFTDNGAIPPPPSKAGIMNNATVVGGDSGGGDFSFNTSTQKWNLIGINEVTGSYSNSAVTFSGMIQLSSYAVRINEIIYPSTDTPTMPFFGLLVLGGFLFLAASLSLDTRLAVPVKDRT
jgi:hypothetical protein